MSLEDKAQEAYNLGIFVGEVKADIKNLGDKMDGFIHRCDGYDKRIRGLETAKNGSKKSVVGYSAGTAGVMLALIEIIKSLLP